MAKLNRALAWEIRTALALTDSLGQPVHTQTALAKVHGVSQAHISYIHHFLRYPLTSTESTSVPDPRFAQPTRCPHCNRPLLADTNGMGQTVVYCPRHP